MRFEDLIERLDVMCFVPVNKNVSITVATFY